MAYGVNAPWGMQVQNSITGAPWTGQLQTLEIASGYANNIFSGDLVTIDTNGYLINYFDTITGPYTPGTQIKPAIGVFAGCSYQSGNTTSVDFASPGRPYWPSGTVTKQGLPAIGFFISDPNAVFDVQAVNGSTFTQASIGIQVPVIYQANGTQVLGNTQTGMSKMGVDVSSAGISTISQPLLVTNLAPAPGNVPGLTWNNAWVIIRNHFYRTAPVGNAAPPPPAP